MAELSSSFTSNWKITYDPSGTPRVLVNYGDEILDEIQMAWNQVVDPAAYTGAAGMDYFGRGRVSMPMSFSVVKTHADDKAMRGWIADLLSGLSAFEKKPLKIEVQGGGGSYQFDVAVLASVTPVPITNGAGAETLTTWRFECGPLRKL